ncbi:hypothetical protein EVAR_32968_1 [Eumeta japonica]|uniref:EF-hand domain-containing protein n=1 Tax=Eumeta variegata TaxID=151549 RepID=A0A4C1WW24_EUMVA|nr:hypothetical protein EVAR_32968_1 [Eumeta japonica]
MFVCVFPCVITCACARVVCLLVSVDRNCDRRLRPEEIRKRLLYRENTEGILREHALLRLHFYAKSAFDFGPVVTAPPAPPLHRMGTSDDTRIRTSSRIGFNCITPFDRLRPALTGSFSVSYESAAPVHVMYLPSATPLNFGPLELAMRLDL